MFRIEYNFAMDKERCRARIRARADAKFAWLLRHPRFRANKRKHDRKYKALPI